MEDWRRLNETQRLLYRELYKKDFYEFTKAFWECADPKKLVDGILIQIYCEIFQYACRWWVPYTPLNVSIPKLEENDELIDVTANPKIHNYNINIPPSHSKSMVLNVLAGCWIWVNEPLEIASISHTADLALTMNKKRQAVLNSEKFKFFFPEIVLKTNTSYSLEDNRGGKLYSINRNAMTGYHASIIINDDITNARVANRDKQEMTNAWDYFRDTMPSRISDNAYHVILNIQQRLSPNDITGHILKNPKLKAQYNFITLPAIFDHKTYIVLPISGELITFEKGQALWPERFGDYENLKDSVGETVFRTQYLQNPLATDRTVIKAIDLVEREEYDVPTIEMANTIYASHDFPVKDKETSDYLGSILGYMVGSTLYIKDCLEKRMNFVRSLDYIKNIDNFYPGCIQIIEDKANGSALLQQLRDEVAGMQAFQPGSRSKMQRLEQCTIYLQNVVFIKTLGADKMTYSLSPALQNLKDKLTSFPFVEHDDVVDAFSQLVLFAFMDKKYKVYGKSFSDLNLINKDNEPYKYKTTFFNFDVDTWKVTEIGVQYGIKNKLIVLREALFKASLKDGLLRLKEFAPDQNVFIDCSDSDALIGVYSNNVIVEKYINPDFEKSVAQLNLAFSNKQVLIDSDCKILINDIENFKYSETNDGTKKFRTLQDGFVGCLRSAIYYYGGL